MSLVRHNRTTVAKPTRNILKTRKKHKKVVTLNTSCEVACLTFQLPHITAGSIQSPRWPPTTGSSELPTFERTQQTFNRMKTFRISQVSVVMFSRQVGKRITVCFLLR